MARQLPSGSHFILAQYGDILLQLAQEKGADPARVLTDAGIHAALLQDADQHLSLQQFSALIRAALKHSQCPSLGLDYGLRLKFTTHGALSQAAISSSTVKDGLQLLIKYYPIRINVMQMRFFVEDEDAVIELDEQVGLGDLKQFLVETLFVSIMDVNRLLFGNQLLMGGQCLIAYPAPSYVAEYHRHFFDAIRFDAGVNQLRFRKIYLDLPLSFANPVARRLALEECEAKLRLLASQETWVGRVNRLLATHRKTLPGIEMVAEALQVSPRTLRRQLQQENARFTDLLATARLTRAKALLAQSHLSIDEIADEAGYSDPSNFGRAFRRALGQSPSAYRAGLSD